MRIRRVHPDEWRVWREIRLEALRSDPAEFGSTLARGDRPRRTRSTSTRCGYTRRTAAGAARRLYARMGFVDAEGEYMDYKVS